MTLADFARSIGISPALARQWKRRGKIVECDGEFGLSDKAAESLVDGGEYLSDESGVTVVSLTASATASRTVMAEHSSVIMADAIEYCRDCGNPIQPESHWPVCKSCHAANPRTDCVATLRQEIVTLRERVTQLERDSGAAQTAIGALQASIERLNIAIVYDRQRIRTIENGPIDSPGPNWGA